MARVSALDIRIEWLDAPDVSTPELAATWARYEIWTGGDCITQVESQDSTFRRSVYGSLYPLAEWITTNWWFLTEGIRPSAVPTRYWTWPNVRTYQWLRQYNFRAAGNGMAWPDLTVVPEGALTCVRWSSDNSRTSGRVKFMSSGVNFVDAQDAEANLANIVVLALDRLAEVGLYKTRLAEDWAALSNLDTEEKEFCATAARLGVDPFHATDELSEAIIEAGRAVPTELSGDFFANAEPENLAQAAEWTRKAARVAVRASARAKMELNSLYAAVSRQERPVPGSTRPWEQGYMMAREVRKHLKVNESTPFDISPWMATGTAADSSGGIQGVAAIERGRFGLVLGGPTLPKPSRLFAQARALGRTLAQPSKNAFLLSSARDYEEQVARAFAAELLAPAEGIRGLVRTQGARDDLAFESIARHFGVSPILVERQYDNQVARTS